MAITVCYDELDSWRFADGMGNISSVLAISDEMIWLDALGPAIVTATNLPLELWRWQDGSTVNTPFDQIADAWHWGDALKTTTTSNLLDAFGWNDGVQITATGSLLDSWRFADAATTPAITASVGDAWRWQDSASYQVSSNLLDTFGWSDALGNASSTAALLDSWRFADGATQMEASLVLLDSWRWQDGATAIQSAPVLLDSWHWQDSPGAIKVTSMASLLDEFYWQDSPSTAKTYQAWVSHLRTFAASTWANLPYCCATAQLMAGPDGIYGHSATRVNALLKTGELDFGASEQKTMTAVYAGVKGSAETLQLDVKSDLQPTYSYPAQAYGTGNVRFVPGRGLRGRHFQLALHSKLPVSELNLELANAKRSSK